MGKRLQKEVKYSAFAQVKGNVSNHQHDEVDLKRKIKGPEKIIKEYDKKLERMEWKVA